MTTRLEAESATQKSRRLTKGLGTPITLRNHAASWVSFANTAAMQKDSFGSQSAVFANAILEGFDGIFVSITGR